MHLFTGESEVAIYSVNSTCEHRRNASGDSERVVLHWESVLTISQMDNYKETAMKVMIHVAHVFARRRYRLRAEWTST